MADKMEDESEEYKFLVTRAKQHERLLEEKELSSPKQRKTRYMLKFNACQKHHKNPDKNCSDCIIFPVQEQLPYSTLPTGLQVLGYFFYLNSVYEEGRKKNVIPDVVADVMNLWISCNVYTRTRKAVTSKLEKLINTYNSLKKVPQGKKHSTYAANLNSFALLCRQLFDIRCIDASRLSCQEKIWKVDECQKDRDFYDGQCKVPQEGYCTRKADRAWLKTNARKEKTLQSLERRRRQEMEVPCDSSQVELDNASQTGEDCGDPSDPDYVPAEKKTKFSFDPVGSRNKDLPDEYCHVRDGLRGIREDVYIVMNKLSSQLHMSRYQVENAIAITVNHLFGLDWKTYNKDIIPDLDTLPCMDNLRQIEPCFEAMALNKIVKEMMHNDSTTVITYSNDGSSRSGVGSFIVQSLRINGKQRALPSFGIFTESRESLAALEVATYKLLSAASFHDYSEQDIFSKVKFCIHDSTSHNLEVTEAVCQELGVEEVPRTLLCNVHPLMMFQGKIKELCQEIHDSLGNKKIHECFLVDVEFKNESFVLKSLKCLSNFINKDYSAKPWNRHTHFSNFICPKKNHSLSLKDHRFNRLNDCALAILYHMDDITRYLEEFNNIINGITILDRSFLEMEVLKPIYVAICIVGIHILKPFHNMIVDKNTNYTTLLQSFPKLYEELCSIAPHQMLTADQIFFFASADQYQKALPHPDLLENAILTAQAYSNEVIQLITLLLGKFARGFEYQKGAIFGFGSRKDDDTGTVLKICNLSLNEIAELDQAQVHNLNEERSVGFLNYELDIRGKQHLEAASRKMVLNKAADLIDVPGESFKTFRKPALEIKDIKLEWNAKMKEMEEKGFSAKQLANIKLESQKLDDLDFLSRQPTPGPFTTSESVSNFMENEPDGKLKNERMYLEIRFQRNSSQSLKKDAAVFRLKRNGKNLETSEYASNLCQFLDQSRSVTNLTMSDLRNVLTGLSSRNANVLGHNISESLASTVVKPSVNTAPQTSLLQCGEHLVAVWHDDDSNALQWYLGVVDSVEEGRLYVSYMKKSDRKGARWLFPDEADVHETQAEQILLRNLQVSYCLTAMIRCELSTETLQTISDLFDKYENSQNMKD